MLELRNIEKYYNPGTINEMCLFDKFNLTVDKGEFVSVVGSNGSGKTSMLNILCGSIPVDGGQILMNGEDITTKKEFKRNQKIGRVYQNPAMGTCPTMTILENMSLADNKGKFFGLSSGINKARKEYYREILSQLAKEEIIPNCSSLERSMKLIGSISRIFMYLPSVVSITPQFISLTGIKSCTNSSFSGFFLCFAFFSFFEPALVIFISHPSEM